MKKEKRVCLISTQYSLLLYMLFCTLEEVQDTFFIFSYGMSKEIANKFPKSIFIEREQKVFGIKVKQWLYCLYIRMFKLGFVGKNTKIFAQDHLLISPSLLYNRDYILIEDSPFIETTYRNSQKYITHKKTRSKFIYKIIKLLYGKTIISAYGNNDLCKGVIMSENEGYIDFLEGKERYLCDLRKAWKNSSEEKLNYILSVFHISKDYIEELNSYKMILFTQPLYPDCLTEEEHRSVFSKILANYSTDNLIIKKHPRDVCDYSTIVPGVKVFSKNIPSQLLDLIGVKFDVAITPFSSAVLDFSYPIQIDWYGTDCHPKLLKSIGRIQPPSNARMCYLNS